MKRVFVGDCDYNTGPSNVNKTFKKYLSQDMYFLMRKHKFLRMIETIIVVIKSEVVVISGLSIINNIALSVANIMKKPVIYLMHGCYVYEAQANQYQLSKAAVKNEKKMLSSAKKIVAVSELYMKWAMDYFPEYKDKFTYLNNGIEWSDYLELRDGERNPYLILSMGGGRPQKNNIVICKAIQLLNEKYKMPFEFVVLGRDYADTDAIKASPYTRYIGQIPKDEVNEWLSKVSIYIQNSEFESFGLAPIEALCSGCNLLVSKNVGAISIISSIQEEDIISDCRNVEEIAQKIIKVFEVGNHDRLLSGIDKDTTSCEYAGKKLLEIIEML